MANFFYFHVAYEVRLLEKNERLKGDCLLRIKKGGDTSLARIREMVAKEVVDTYHDKVTEAVLLSLTPLSKKEYEMLS